MAGRLTRRRFTRRSFLAASAATLIARPALSRAADRPAITHGLQSGDVTTDSAVVWARTDRPARLRVEIATTESFADALVQEPVDALPESDFTAKLPVEDLPAGADIFYRVRFEDLAHPTVLGAAQVGRFRTAPREARSLSFVWSGDTAGQGWGIDESRGGLRTYATMHRDRPDFFIHCGDGIYADCPIQAEEPLSNGEVWKNLVTEEKSRVAETLADYRGNYKYNLRDANLRAFNAETPVFAQWDDHEVTDDWWPGLMLSDRMDHSALLLAARGRRAFHEFTPMRPSLSGRIYRRIPYGPLLDVFMLDMRSYRGPNGQEPNGSDGDLLGPAQVAWLKRGLAASRATWKVIVADLPIGLVSYDGVGQGDGEARGREREIAALLSFIKHAGVRNTFWITADVHYTAAHRYDPNRAVFQDFLPFWEFVSGPLHAGTGCVAMLDNTFGPAVAYHKASEQGDNLAPCFGLQFYGHVAIDGASRAMTVTLKDVAGDALWAVTLPAEPPAMALRT
jgi:alkaline phosphatase D